MIHICRYHIVRFQATTSSKLWKSLRSQEMELSKRYLPGVADLKRLATIDSYLAQIYLGHGKQDQARSLMEKSIGYCEAYLAHSPGDVEIQGKMFGAANWMMMNCLGNSKNDQLYEQWNARAIVALERLKSSRKVYRWGMFEISRWKRRHATFLLFAGETDRARKELEQDLALVQCVPVAETWFPEFVLSEALAFAALGQWSGEFTPLRSPIQPGSANVAIQDLELGLAELTARRIGWLPSIVKSPWLIPADIPTEAWTDRVISSVKSDASKFGLDHTRIPAISWSMRDHCASTMTRQRQAGKLGNAHRIADQLVALAERLTRSYPDQAAAYMLLSEGYVQKAKIAYREDQAPVIKRWERKALEAATHAATLEPDNDEAHSLVKDRLRRLDKLASK